MRLKARPLDIKAGGKKIAILDDETASLLGVRSSDRVEIGYKKEHIIAIVNIASDFPRNHVGLYEEISKELGTKVGDTVQVRPSERPKALGYIQAKIRGERLRKNEVKIIIKDVAEHRLSDVELASFLTALYIHGISMGEIDALSRAMVESGTTLNLGSRLVLDKHSIGGIPGDKTSLLIVPIVAAAGFIIPKTSSRAVTSPAGTADRVEALCNVNLTVEEIKEVVGKTNGCMVWGGALELAPADDIFIRVEYPLAIDPLLLPSIMSKKKAIGATHVVIDIPTGRGSKIKTMGEASALASDFIDLGKSLKINVQCAVTFGEQPIGYAVGPTLEAREALSALMGKGPSDLREKATSVAGMLLEMAGVENGKKTAETILKSGKAEKKFREIIEAQGGDPHITPEDLEVGCKKMEITSEKDGRILWINNKSIAQVAREAGAPKEKGAGITLKVKLGEYTRKGEVLFEVFSERNTKLEAATRLAKRLQPIGLSKKPEERMLMDRITAGTIHRRTRMMLER